MPVFVRCAIIFAYSTTHTPRASLLYHQAAAEIDWMYNIPSRFDCHNIACNLAPILLEKQYPWGVGRNELHINSNKYLSICVA
jgi:hypothetical protein